MRAVRGKLQRPALPLTALARTPWLVDARARSPARSPFCLLARALYSAGVEPGELRDLAARAPVRRPLLPLEGLQTRAARRRTGERASARPDRARYARARALGSPSVRARRSVPAPRRRGRRRDSSACLSPSQPVPRLCPPHRLSACLSQIVMVASPLHYGPDRGFTVPEGMRRPRSYSTDLVLPDVC